MTRPHTFQHSASTARPLTSTQVLLNAIQVKSPTKQMIPAIVLLNAIKPKSASSTESGASAATASEHDKVRSCTITAEESSKALKRLLVISTETAPAPLSSALGATSIGSRQLTPVKTTIKQSTAANVKNAAAVKELSTINQKDKVTKICKERTKSRSNSEDADFYAGSAILNSPSPQAIPLPDFDESYDFFSNVESHHTMGGNLRLSLVR